MIVGNDWESSTFLRPPATGPVTFQAESPTGSARAPPAAGPGRAPCRPAPWSGQSRTPTDRSARAADSARCARNAASAWPRPCSGRRTNRRRGRAGSGVRSPHSSVFAVLGRTGFLGLAISLVLVGLMIARTRTAAKATRAGLDGTTRALSWWCACWVILTSACFGVVLENPMGASSSGSSWGSPVPRPRPARKPPRPMKWKKLTIRLCSGPKNPPCIDRHTPPP